MVNHKFIKSLSIFFISGNCIISSVPDEFGFKVLHDIKTSFSEMDIIILPYLTVICNSFSLSDISANFGLCVFD